MPPRFTPDCVPFHYEMRVLAVFGGAGARTAATREGVVRPLAELLCGPPSTALDLISSLPYDWHCPWRVVLVGVESTTVHSDVRALDVATACGGR